MEFVYSIISTLIVSWVRDRVFRFFSILFSYAIFGWGCPWGTLSKINTILSLFLQLFD